MLAYHSTGFELKSTFGPEKLPGLLRNEPLEFVSCHKILGSSICVDI